MKISPVFLKAIENFCGTKIMPFIFCQTLLILQQYSFHGKKYYVLNNSLEVPNNFNFISSEEKAEMNDQCICFWRIVIEKITASSKKMGES